MRGVGQAELAMQDRFVSKGTQVQSPCFRCMVSAQIAGVGTRQLKDLIRRAKSFPGARSGCQTVSP